MYPNTTVWLIWPFMNALFSYATGCCFLLLCHYCVLLRRIQTYKRRNAILKTAIQYLSLLIKGMTAKPTCLGQQHFMNAWFCDA